MNGHDWRNDAACRGLPPALFIDVNGNGRTNQALACCMRCPVRTACLNYALHDHELVGVWGGTTAKDRRRIRVANGARPGATKGDVNPIRHHTPAADAAAIYADADAATHAQLVGTQQ
jgi:WhiB family transcriptional regulator, redox-sensing transcriptional regulator